MLKDAAAIGGLVLVGVGVAFIYWPLALVVVGVLLLLGGLVGHFRARPDRREGGEHGPA